MGRPGGGLCGCNPGAGPYVDNRLVTRPDFRKKPGRRVNINEIASALQGTGERSPYAASMSTEQSGSLCLLSEGNHGGLLRPDLFTVVHERFMTDTAMYADILLPAAFSVEQTDVYTAYGYCTFGTARKIIERPDRVRAIGTPSACWLRPWDMRRHILRRQRKRCLRELLAHPMEGRILYLRRGSGVY